MRKFNVATWTIGQKEKPGSGMAKVSGKASPGGRGCACPRLPRLASAWSTFHVGHECIDCKENNKGGETFSGMTVLKTREYMISS